MAQSGERQTEDLKVPSSILGGRTQSLFFALERWEGMRGLEKSQRNTVVRFISIFLWWVGVGMSQNISVIPGDRIKRFAF